MQQESRVVFIHALYYCRYTYKWEEGNERMALKFWREMYLAGKMLRISCVSVYHLSAHPVKASFILPRNDYLFLSNSYSSEIFYTSKYYHECFKIPKFKSKTMSIISDE